MSVWVQRPADGSVALRVVLGRERWLRRLIVVLGRDADRRGLSLRVRLVVW